MSKKTTKKSTKKTNDNVGISGSAIALRKDPKTGYMREAILTIKNGKEVSQVWLDEYDKKRKESVKINYNKFDYDTYAEKFDLIINYARYDRDMHVIRDRGDLFEIYDESYEETIKRLKKQGYKIDTIKDKPSVLDSNEMIFCSFDSPLLKVIEKSIKENKVK